MSARLWQHIPEHLDPIIFSIGNFAVYWYSVMWLMAFAICYALLVYRIKKGESSFTKEFMQDVIIYALIGAIAGGRLGYVLFYDLAYYVAHPLLIVSPYDPSANTWTGIYGMSYHGGLIGVIIALFLFARKRNIQSLHLFDFIVPVVPLGYMCGRVGNFLNQELVGRVTSSQWGMYFNNEIYLRHPSQLYEAFMEGVVLFLILWKMRNNKWHVGIMSGLYIIGYALMRFMVEFFREPDAHIGFVWMNLSMGQIMSAGMFIIGVVFIVYNVKMQK